MSNQFMWLILIVLHCRITALPPKQCNRNHFSNLQNCALCEEGFHASAFWWECFIWRGHDQTGDCGFSGTQGMAGLPFEHSPKFGVILQFILHPNWTLLALWKGWVQDRAFLEIHPCWLESANACAVKHEEMFPDRWVGQVLSWKGSCCMTRSLLGIWRRLSSRFLTIRSYFSGLLLGLHYTRQCWHGPEDSDFKVNFNSGIQVWG